MVASSSGAMATSGSVAVGSSTSSSRSTPSTSAVRRTPITASPRPACTGARRSTRSWSATQTLAPQSWKPYSSSSVVHQALRATATAPMEVMAWKATIHSG